MKATLLISVLLGTLPQDLPNLCEDALLGADGSTLIDSSGRTLPRYCEWTGPDVPTWDDSVCCVIDDDSATCVAPNSRGICEEGEAYFCEFGELTATGSVVCYQPFPSMCDSGLCIAPPAAVPPTAQIVDPGIACCSPGGACVVVPDMWTGGCEGDYLACMWGMTNEDGTVDCFD